MPGPGPEVVQKPVAQTPEKKPDAPQQSSKKKEPVEDSPAERVRLQIDTLDDHRDIFARALGNGHIKQAIATAKWLADDLERLQSTANWARGQSETDPQVIAQLKLAERARTNVVNTLSNTFMYLGSADFDDVVAMSRALANAGSKAGVLIALPAIPEASKGDRAEEKKEERSAATTPKKHPEADVAQPPKPKSHELRVTHLIRNPQATGGEPPFIAVVRFTEDSATEIAKIGGFGNASLSDNAAHMEAELERRFGARLSSEELARFKRDASAKVNALIKAQHGSSDGLSDEDER